MIAEFRARSNSGQEVGGQRNSPEVRGAIKKPFVGGAGTYKGPSVWELPPSHVFHYDQPATKGKHFLKDFLSPEKSGAFCLN